MHSAQSPFNFHPSLAKISHLSVLSLHCKSTARLSLGFAHNIYKMFHPTIHRHQQREATTRGSREAPETMRAAAMGNWRQPAIQPYALRCILRSRAAAPSSQLPHRADGMYYISRGHGRRRKNVPIGSLFAERGGGWRGWGDMSGPAHLLKPAIAQHCCLLPNHQL